LNTTLHSNNEYSQKDIEKLISNFHYLLLMQENKFLLSMYEIFSRTQISKKGKITGIMYIDKYGRRRDFNVKILNFRTIE